jgi:hypothetical protein
MQYIEELIMNVTVFVVGFTVGEYTEELTLNITLLGVWVWEEKWKESYT